nr:hypothetical protein CFP56_43465 [Quercus suber]
MIVPTAKRKPPTEIVVTTANGTHSLILTTITTLLSTMSIAATRMATTVANRATGRGRGSRDGSTMSPSPYRLRYQFSSLIS